jgi:hypothetical protein
VCSLQGPACIAHVSGDEDTRAQREKTERDSTEEPTTMRTVVDTAPRCRRPAHADRGTKYGRVDQGDTHDPNAPDHRQGAVPLVR